MQSNNGGSFARPRIGSLLAAIRASVPPQVGTRWLLDPTRAKGSIVTEHPILSFRRFPLSILAGTFGGLPGGQVELALTMKCQQRSRGSSPADSRFRVLFKSTSFESIDAFHFKATGQLYVCDVGGVSAVNIRDLGWTTAADARDQRRILTISCNLTRRFWNHATSPIPAPWFTRDSARVLLNTEWRPDLSSRPAA